MGFKKRVNPATALRGSPSWSELLCGNSVNIKGNEASVSVESPHDTAVIADTHDEPYVVISAV